MLLLFTGGCRKLVWPFVNNGMPAIGVGLKVLSFESLEDFIRTEFFGQVRYFAGKGLFQEISYLSNFAYDKNT